MKEPWCKFYPRDWRGDSLLQSLPLQARGLWAEMLCLMAMSEKKGFLLVNGKAPSPRQIATLVCADVRTVLHTLLQLENVGVFTRDENGVIYCRRMAREAFVSAERRAAINLRWAAKKPENQPLLNIQNTIQKSDFVCTHIPVPEEEKEEEESPLTPQGGEASLSRSVSLDEVRTYAVEVGQSIESAERFHAMNEAGGWRDKTGKKIGNWRKAFLSFSKKDSPHETGGKSGLQDPEPRRTKRKTFYNVDHSKGF